MIENLITELIKAVNSNTEALLGRGQIPLAATTADAGTQTPAPEAEKPKTTKTKPKPVEAPVVAPVEPPAPSEAPKGPTLAELRDTAQKCLDSGVKPDQIRTVCGKYEAKRVSEVKPENFAALAEDLKNLLDASSAT